MYKNNFDFLRLVFSVFVVITHSHILSGAGEGDFLYSITNSQTNFSYIGVRGFFIISGFLIFQSLLRSKGVIEFYWKRMLRLFPALFVVLVLTILILPVVYESVMPYIRNKEVWTYVPNNLSLYHLQFTISGVFKNNPSSGINGSLWTLCYEFSLYIFLSSLIIIRKNNTLIKWVLLILFLFFSLMYINSSGNNPAFYRINFHGNLFNLSAFFFSGALFASFENEFYNYRKSLLVSGVFLIILAFSFSFFEQVQFFVLPLIVISCGTLSTNPINCISEQIGDLSYGIYIYSFPTQQILMHFFKFSYSGLLSSSIMISIIFAFASWHIIEKRALRYKKLLH